MDGYGGDGEGGKKNLSGTKVSSRCFYFKKIKDSCAFKFFTRFKYNICDSFLYYRNSCLLKHFFTN